MAPTRVFILGGTEFVGRAFVDEALARGHDVTVLNRGSREPLDGVTTLVGCRADSRRSAPPYSTSSSTPGRGHRGR